MVLGPEQLSAIAFGFIGILAILCRNSKCFARSVDSHMDWGVGFTEPPIVPTTSAEFSGLSCPHHGCRQDLLPAPCPHHGCPGNLLYFSYRIALCCQTELLTFSCRITQLSAKPLFSLNTFLLSLSFFTTRRNNLLSMVHGHSQ